MTLVKELVFQHCLGRDTTSARRWALNQQNRPPATRWEVARASSRINRQNHQERTRKRVTWYFAQETKDHGKPNSDHSYGAARALSRRYTRDKTPPSGQRDSAWARASQSYANSASIEALLEES